MKTTEIIKELILEETGIDIADKLRTRTNVEFRSMYFNIIKNLEPKLSLREIGEAVNRDHATVIYGLNQLETLGKKFPSICGAPRLNVLSFLTNLP